MQADIISALEPIQQFFFNAWSCNILDFSKDNPKELLPVNFCYFSVGVEYFVGQNCKKLMLNTKNSVVVWEVTKRS